MLRHSTDQMIFTEESSLLTPHKRSFKKRRWSKLRMVLVTVILFCVFFLVRYIFRDVSPSAMQTENASFRDHKPPETYLPPRHRNPGYAHGWDLVANTPRALNLVNPDVPAGTNSQLLGSGSRSFPPLSRDSPVDLGFLPFQRTVTRPGLALAANKAPFPTNIWYQSMILGEPLNASTNRLYVMPYVVDTAGVRPGVRAHASYLLTSDVALILNFNEWDGFVLGAAEELGPQRVGTAQEHYWSNLAVVLEWPLAGKGSSIHLRAPVVRGMPYLTMEYTDATPQAATSQPLSTDPVVDDYDGNGQHVQCGQGNTFGPVFTIKRELSVHFKMSDMTWMLFPSQSIEVQCSSGDLGFSVKSTKVMDKFTWRAAIANNCTSGHNPIFCQYGQAHERTAWKNELRRHAHLYPTGAAQVRFSFQDTKDTSNEEKLRTQWQMMSGHHSEEMQMIFDWGITAMRTPEPGEEVSSEALMFSLPHHDQMEDLQVLGHCWPSLRGYSCPTVGNQWVLRQQLVDVSFYTAQGIQPEMLPDLAKALQEDLKFQPSKNYMRGAGDTYFSGKMLAKLARILMIAHEPQLEGQIDQALIDAALNRLRQGVEIWFNGSAESPLMYDSAWGGVVSCGCLFNEERQTCDNKYPDCPNMFDPGANFGNGFYNDHHFHYGYHIYAAAVVSYFDLKWRIKFHPHVLALVRDIANPSDADPYFPMCRHKDWYLGSSWANGIVPVNPNGRNQESSSEAIHAYEAVALYGQVLANRAGLMGESDKPSAPDELTEEEVVTLTQLGSRMEQIGRVLLSTELSSVQLYWHVLKQGTPQCHIGVTRGKKEPCRVYPDQYRRHAVGMLWSFLVNFQTWFGPEPWKCYGIQLMPLTVASGARDDPNWVKQMLPDFSESCLKDALCMHEGWSVLVYASQATIGQWREAWKGVMSLDASVFNSAGGNGHSRSNSLWFVGTRPDPDAAVPVQTRPPYAAHSVPSSEADVLA